MRLIDIETLKLREFFGDEIPPYAILSHTWGRPEEELSFEDIGKEHIEKPGKIKLEGCCKQAKKDQLGYVWIDTCCIKQDSSREFEEAINSMFEWYRRASICYVHLSDISYEESSLDGLSVTGCNIHSRWFQRGWTLQELLAPQKLQFYDRSWKYIGDREDLAEEIWTIANIPTPFLLGWEDLHTASVAQRMLWAANRKTTRREDVAYCLLGIFDVTMSMLYGEGGEKAFIRLQQEIMKKTGDQSILAWGLNLGKSTLGKQTDVLSIGVLATSPSDFADSGDVSPRTQDATFVNTFDISGGRLRAHLPLYTSPAGAVYGLLNCGDSKRVVGIPLHKLESGGPSDEYFRPQGQNAILLGKTKSAKLTKTVYIKIESDRNAPKITSPRCWLRIEGYQNMDLKLAGVYPQIQWDRGRGLIITTKKSEAEDATGRYIIRFHGRSEISRDIAVILEVDKHSSQPSVRSHITTLSRDTTSEHLSHKIKCLKPEAFGKQNVTNDELNVRVLVEEERVMGEPVFIMRLARAFTPLLWAAFNGYEAETRLLLDKGANIELGSKAPVTCLVRRLDGSLKP